MDRTDSPLFYSSTLLFSDESMERLSTSVVAVAGVGGVGAVAAEMLVRMGVGRVRIADPDVYEAVNRNRQLFATASTEGRNKAVAAAERLVDINPDLHIDVFEQGVTLETIEPFIEDAAVALCQADRESTKVLIHRAAKARGVPVVSGARASIHDHRWKVRATVRNYRDEPSLQCYDEVFHEDMCVVADEELTEEVLRGYDEKVRTKDRGVFKELALTRPEAYGSIDADSLAERIDTADNFNKRTVCAVIANTAGCLAATAVVRLLLGGPLNDLEINLWTGE